MWIAFRHLMCFLFAGAILAVEAILAVVCAWIDMWESAPDCKGIECPSDMN